MRVRPSSSSDWRKTSRRSSCVSDREALNSTVNLLPSVLRPSSISIAARHGIESKFRWPVYLDLYDNNERPWRE